MLPVQVRTHVAVLAADALAGLPVEDVPPTLKAVARFTPAKRAKLGSVALLQAVEGDPVFRRKVVDLAKERHPAPTDPALAAAVAYLLGSEGWAEQVAAVAEKQPRGPDVDVVQRLTEQLSAVRATARQEAADLREQVKAAQDEAAVARKKLRDMGDRTGRAEQAQRAAEAARDVAQVELATVLAGQENGLAVLREQLLAAEQALAAARQTTREGVKGDQLRLRLLLDAVVGAAAGLRRELALPPAEGRPADALAGSAPAPLVQGRSDDDPALLDALLCVPTTHLLVDGYNVTKTAYPTLTLQAQRTRLLAGLGALTARTGVELTVVFDGADGVMPVAVAAPRGVRLVFSRTGETADEVLRRYARNEPEGRPVVVVSTDKEVADGVRRVGARAVPSIALVRLLERSSVGGAP